MIIFLDIDGVLNNHNQKPISYENSFYVKRQVEKECVNFDENNVNALKSLLSNFDDVKIIVSSTWRNLVSYTMLKDIFSLYDIEIHGITPNLLGRRGDDINAWLVDRDVNSYIILDDNNDFYRDQNLLLVDPLVGLTNDDVNNYVHSVS